MRIEDRKGRIERFRSRRSGSRRKATHLSNGPTASVLIAFNRVSQGRKGQQKQLASPLKFSSFQAIYRFVGAAKGADNDLLKKMNETSMGKRMWAHMRLL